MEFFVDLEFSGVMGFPFLCFKSNRVRLLSLSLRDPGLDQMMQREVGSGVNTYYRLRVSKGSSKVLSRGQQEGQSEKHQREYYWHWSYASQTLEAV